LLIDLATTGNGTYMFIPDSGLVGTVFVNLISNLLSTMTSNLTISLEPGDGTQILEVLGAHEFSDQSWGKHGSIGALTYGQPRGLVVRMDAPIGADQDVLHATVEYRLRGSKGDPTKITTTLNNSAVKQQVHEGLEAERLRLDTTKTIFDAMALTATSNGSVDYEKLPQSRELLEALTAKILAQKSLIDSSEKLKDLGKDVTGQITEAFSKKEWFGKWGRHYLPSLGRAHLLQQCNNFKDPGVQHYGGTLYNEIRDKADKIFIGLPAPKPTVVQQSFTSFNSYSKGASRSLSSKKSRPVNMQRNFYSRSNPCFDGSNLVAMADGRMKLVRSIKKGDSVKTPLGSAKVRCVVKTLVAPATELVQLPSGLLLTPWHPVRHKGKWTFPATLAAITEQKCESIYSFILDQHHSMFIEGTEAVTLGHNFTENEVIRHPYFGSQAVIHDLSQFEGWQAGLVTFSNECLERNDETGLLYKFKSTSQVLTA